LSGYVLACVDRRTQGLHKELNGKMDGTQVDLQAVRTCLDTQTRSLLETTADMRKDLHEELGLMIHVETQPTKPLVETTRREFERQLKEVEARAARRAGGLFTTEA
jgi:ABC-type transporter Mla subunit MlaD